MLKSRKIHLALLMLITLSLLLAACGSTATNTSAPATTAPASAATTAARATTAPASAATTAPAANTTAATSATTAPAVNATTVPAANATTAATTTGNPYANVSTIAALPDLPANAQKGGKFTEVIGAKLAPALHPYPNNTSNTSTRTYVANLIFGAPLANYNYNSLKWELEAAKSLSVSSDNKTFTWTLRNDLKWSDGSAITVDDIQFAYDNISKEDKVDPGNNYVGLTTVQRIASHKVDAATNTVIVTLTEPYPYDLAMLYASQVFPLPKKVWEGKPFQDATKNPEILKPTVVSGPYMIDSYDPNSQGVFKPNPYWYRGKPNFDQIVMISADPTVMVESVKTGQSDWGSNFPPAQVAQVKGDNNLAYYEWTAVNAGYRYIEYNMLRNPLSDKAFRQAINYAMDRDSLIKLAEAGLGSPQYTFVNPASPFYNKETNAYKFNLDTSRKLLTDAGYKLEGGKLLGKDGKPIELTVAYPTSSPPRKLIATYMEQQLKQLGINVKVDGKEFQAYINQTDAGDYDINLGNRGGGFADPDTQKNIYITKDTSNKSGYSNPRVDELFGQGAKELDPAKRKAIYDEIQKITNEETPIFYLWSLTDYAVVSKKVQGIVAPKGKYLEGNDAITRWYYLAS